MALHHEEQEQAHKVATTPKDFFLWLGVIIALYGSITSFLTLLFQYINIAYPDALTYEVDSYTGAIRVAMATLIILIPVTLGLLVTIRRDIVRTPGKANVWVRRWALVLTIFLGGAVAVVDLITLLTTFLGGELTVRFVLKALVVLLVAVAISLHFLADYWGYWTLHRRKVALMGAAVGALAVMTVIAGFLIIGSPARARQLQIDQQMTGDLSSIQYKITSYWQNKQSLPSSLDMLNDPYDGYTVPKDPKGNAYEYRTTGNLSYQLCATFNQPTNIYGDPYTDSSGYGNNDNLFRHGAGHTCYSRTIDPTNYPPVIKD